MTTMSDIRKAPGRAAMAKVIDEALVRGGYTDNKLVGARFDQLADAAVAQADELPPVGPDHVRPLMSCSPFEPPEFGKSVAECRSDDDE